LAERAAEKCIQEDLLANQLGARAIRDKLNDFLWKERQHVEVRELVDWCRKYLYLPRITADQVILDALVNPSAALSGEATFYLADSFDAGSGRYQGLGHSRHQATNCPASIPWSLRKRLPRTILLKQKLSTFHLDQTVGQQGPPDSSLSYHQQEVAVAPSHHQSHLQSHHQYQLRRQPSQHP
jgi:hypothetical protein